MLWTPCGCVCVVGCGHFVDVWFTFLLAICDCWATCCHMCGAYSVLFRLDKRLKGFGAFCGRVVGVVRAACDVLRTFCVVLGTFCDALWTCCGQIEECGVGKEW